MPGTLFTVSTTITIHILQAAFYVFMFFRPQFRICVKSSVVNDITHFTPNICGNVVQIPKVEGNHEH